MSRTKKNTGSAKAVGVIKKDEKVMVRFIKSPAGVYKIAAEIGREKAFNPKQAAELVESGFAEYV